MFVGNDLIWLFLCFRFVCVFLFICCVCVGWLVCGLWLYVLAFICCLLCLCLFCFVSDLVFAFVFVVLLAVCTFDSSMNWFCGFRVFCLFCAALFGGLVVSLRLFVVFDTCGCFFVICYNSVALFELEVFDCLVICLWWFCDFLRGFCLRVWFFTGYCVSV